MADRTHKQNMIIMARAFALAMNRQFFEDVNLNKHWLDAPDGAWFIERADTEKPRYRLAERCVGGGINHPLSSSALTAEGLGDALCFARLAVNVDRTENRQDYLDLKTAARIYVREFDHLVNPAGSWRDDYPEQTELKKLLQK
jgi:hypothetical protein